MSNLMLEIEDSAQYLRAQLPRLPRIGLILGSGLGSLAAAVQDPVEIAYHKIPHFPESTVPGHAGRIVAGNLAGGQVLVMQGRFHYYEGYTLQEVTYPVRVMASLGLDYLVVTNAAGGINPNYRPGDLMLITDHLNLLGANPLRGPNMDAFGPRFPDMTRAYHPQLQDWAREAAAAEEIELREGIYACGSGPSYETPAEVRWLRQCGADAVGMSTVPEVIIANHCGMAVAGISCITNLAAGLTSEGLNHQDVIDTAARTGILLARLVQGLIGRIVNE